MKFDKRIVPNIFTFGNLCLGMLAIMLGVKDQELAGSILILIAGVLDRYDGIIARKLGVESDLGKELDSLSDLVSFGLAPSLLAWHLGLKDLNWIGISIALIFLSAGAYRLARYNISTPSSSGIKVFTGVPITVAGGLLSIYNIYIECANIIGKPNVEKFTIFFMLVLSYLMVSKLQIKKL